MASSTFNSLLCIALLVFVSQSTAQSSFRPRALVLPVTKDSATQQYVAQFKQRTPLVPVKLAIDLGGEALWVDCEQGYVSSSFKLVRCRTAQCALANSGACSGNTTCFDFPHNPFSRTSTGGEVAEDVLSIQSTDGSNPGKSVSVPGFLFICAPTFLLKGLANGLKGVAGLGRIPLGVPTQVSRAFSFNRKFALCLSSGSGVIFFGNGPYYLLPLSNDFSKSLTYTPLLINPVSTGGVYKQGDRSADYFIGITSIKINNEVVPLNKTLLSFDKAGNGGTLISTVVPYTVLETSIYKAFTETFIKQVGNIPRVAPVAPFSTCYDIKSFAPTRLGFNVPEIRLVLQNEKVYWQIFGTNSIVQVNSKVVCLAFVDGGVDPRTSIVIGAHQIEEKFLEFDVASSRLGFSATLSAYRTSCANFNFTSNA